MDTSGSVQDLPQEPQRNMRKRRRCVRQERSGVGVRGRNALSGQLDQASRSYLSDLQVATTEAGAIIIRESLPDVVANAAHLCQLFQNLVGNAIKYRRPGIVPEVRVKAHDDGANRKRNPADFIVCASRARESRSAVRSFSGPRDISGWPAVKCCCPAHLSHREPARTRMLIRWRA